MGTNHRRRINLLLTICAVNCKFHTAARAKRIIRSNGGAAGWAKLLIAFGANIGIVGDNSMTGGTAS
jgi:hypothetical protein